MAWPAIIGMVMSMLGGKGEQSQMFEGQRSPFERLPPAPAERRGDVGSLPLYNFDMERYREQSPMLRRQPQMSPTPMMYPYLGR